MAGMEESAGLNWHHALTSRRALVPAIGERRPHLDEPLRPSRPSAVTSFVWHAHRSLEELPKRRNGSPPHTCGESNLL